MMLYRRHEARQQVLQTALAVLTAEQLPADTPRRVLHIDAALDQLELAARNLTRAISEGDPQDWPVGWDAVPSLEPR